MDKRPGRGRGAAGSGPRGTGGQRGGISGRLGAIPKVYELSDTQKWRESPYSRPYSTRGMNGRFRGSERPGQTRNQKQHINHRILNFEILVKLASDKIEPSEIIRCLGNPENDLASFLEENWRNVEYLELIIVALGEFCKKDGVSQFTESFVNIVKMLAQQKIFAQITSIIINIPTSCASNLPTRQTRLKRLINAIYHIATEILVMMPASGCEFLGQNFFTDLLSLEMMPSIKNLNVPDAFNILQEGIPLLEVSLRGKLLNFFK